MPKTITIPFTVAFIAIVLFAQTQPTVVIGTQGLQAIALGTQTLNSTNTYYCTEQRYPTAVNITGFRWYINAAPTGTPVAGDFAIELRANNTSGNPDFSGGAIVTATTNALPAGAGGAVSGSFASTALTAGTIYWVCIRNTAAVSGDATAHYIVIRSPASHGGQPQIVGGATNGFTGMQKTSSNAGSTWTGAAGSTSFFRADLNGTYAGHPYSAQGIDPTAIVYAAREVASMFTMPGPVGLTWKIRYVCAPVSRLSNPTQNLIFKLYTGTSGTLTEYVSANSYTPNTLDTGGKSYCGEFATVVSIAGGTTVRATIAENTQSDAASNAYRPWLITLENDANSIALRPMGASLSVCTGTCTTRTNWTEADPVLQFLPFAIIAEQGSEATAGGGGGSYAFVQ